MCKRYLKRGGKKIAALKAIGVELSYVFITVIRGELPFSDNCQQTEEMKKKTTKKTQKTVNC